MSWARTAAVLGVAAACMLGLPGEVTDLAAAGPAAPAPVDMAAAPVGYQDGPATDEVAAAPTTTTTTRPRATTTTTVRKTTAPTASSGQAVSSQTAPAATGAYALHYNGDGSVVRWNPCAAITWKANLSLAPAGALADIEAAVAGLSQATGITFQYGGTTTVLPTDSWLHGKSDPRTIVVAWAPKSATDLFSNEADGEGGWYEQGTSDDGEHWVWQIQRGYVLMDVAGTADYAAGFGKGVTRGALLLHELAHAVGLSHVEDRTQLMYPTLSDDTLARYGTGDLAGLTRLGRGAGCIG